MLESKNKFLKLIGISEDDYNRVVKNLNNYYYIQKVPKKTKRGKYKYHNGQKLERTLCPSNGKLKILQNKIKNFLIKEISFPDYYFGGIKGKDNIRNAEYHKGNHYFLLTDLKDFYPSISAKTIYDNLLKIGCSHDISRIITRLSTFDNKLPQGIPCATVIANIVTLKMSKELNDYCKSKEIKFSIFVDDLTFSSQLDFSDSADEIMAIIRKYYFKISYKKTLYKTGKSVVTGVTVRQNKLTPSSYNYYNYKNAKKETKKSALKNYLKRVEYDKKLVKD